MECKIEFAANENLNTFVANFEKANTVEIYPIDKKLHRAILICLYSLLCICSITLVIGLCLIFISF